MAHGRDKLIAQYPLVDYALVKREATYDPWIAAYHYDDSDGTWGQGHYFQTEEDALDWIRRKYEEELTVTDLAKATMEYDRMTF